MTEVKLEMWKSEASRWAAVKNRDPAADGTFVYAVRTTKVYCRPVCKARLARRANVSFFAIAQDAEGAGFRPCKRCKPDAQGAMPEERAVQKIRAFIREKPESSPSLPSPAPTPGDTGSTHTPEPDLQRLADLARQAGVSKWHFHRVFKNVTGVTPAEFLHQRQRAREALDATGSTTNQDWSGSEGNGVLSVDILDSGTGNLELDYLLANSAVLFRKEEDLVHGEDWWDFLTEEALSLSFQN